jgi:DNA adenine methylase
MKPFLKWVGGKRKIITHLEQYFPLLENRNYHEPFVGAGSVFMHFKPIQCYISDINESLMNCYSVIRDNLSELKNYLLELSNKNTPDFYQKLRTKFNIMKKENHMEHCKVEFAALFIYLNKAGFGGIYRENKKGEMNVPFGKYKKLSLYEENNLEKISSFLKKINISNQSYKESLVKVKKGDFVYLDPPYHQEKKTSFTGYNSENFSEKDQEELAEEINMLHQKGVYFILSNSNTTLINKLYKHFIIIPLSVGRHINNYIKINSDEKEKKEKKEKKENEVIILNFTLDTDHNPKIINQHYFDSKEEKKETFEKYDLLEECKDWLLGQNIWNHQNQSDKKMAIYEKEWSKKLFHKYNMKWSIQWTTILGEKLTFLQLEKIGLHPKKPKKIKSYKPDIETDDFIWEVKTRTWSITGTAGEKVAGVPFKYSDIPILYGKPLKIILLAYQEYEAVHKMLLFCDIENSRKKKYLDIWKEDGIEFVRFSDLLKT